VREAGRGPAVVLCHGFPELAYSWRHQIPVLAGAGFRVIAPDQRGYGGSDAPEPVEAYDLEHLTDDLAALLDALRIERAVFAGHDWGGVVAWGMPVRHPSRVAGVIGMNQPYSSLPDLEFLRRAVADDEEFYAPVVPAVRGGRSGARSASTPGLRDDDAPGRAAARRDAREPLPRARDEGADRLSAAHRRRDRRFTRAPSRAGASAAPSTGTATWAGTSGCCRTSGCGVWRCPA
jgi:pimeloyl-ACP methyl ester carboxylesterase